MTTEKLALFISINISTFSPPEIIESGIAYHYTSHWDKIEQCGKFLGAVIDKNLDKTQTTLISEPAINDPGVVFGYLDETHSRAEGFGCDVVEIRFKKAIKTVHEQEASFGGTRLHTILMLNTEIDSYRKI